MISTHAASKVAIDTDESYAAAPPIALQDGPAANRRYANDDRLPWQEELVPIPKTRGFAEFYDNVAAAIRDGAPLATKD